jgi:glycosyltransferase involved in cell wall biosynthesis
MAMGLPVVTTDIRGCREAVVHGETGLIVPPKDRDRLAEALRILLADPMMRQTYGQASRQRVEAEYDERLVFQRLVTAYQDLGITRSDAGQHSHYEPASTTPELSGLHQK